MKLSPVLILRIGLAAVFIYAGIHMFFDPQSWIGFVPDWVDKILSREIFLYIHSGLELALGLMLLLGIFLPFVSLVSFFDIVAILLFYGIDDVTFRDFGLAMMALALFLFAKEKRNSKS